ncbi:hypothetical protein ABXS75_18470 [Roseburia hominis]
MVCKLDCDCDERIEINITSIKELEKVKEFFSQQIKQGIFVEEIPQKPYYVWKERDRVKEWFATKWYRCLKCGCLWEVNYPDFPAKGFIRKFSDGIYKEQGY